MEQPDELDLNIIAILRTNPRITNKEIAQQIDIAESTVAQRIRSMADRRIMKIVAQKHIFSDGHQLMCFFFVHTSQRTVQSISADIAQQDAAISVVQGVGNPDIFVVLRARSLDHAHELAALVGRINGVDAVEVCACIRVYKYVSAWGDIAATEEVSEAERDSIFVPLSQDGRQSNREVARQLGISEGTVRQRLNKLLKNGTMQFEVVCNPASFAVEMTALARISTLSRYTNEIREQLQQIDEFTFVAETTGPTNLLAVALTSNAQTLGDICDNHLMSLRGVQSVQVQLIAGVAKQLVHYAYFDAPSEIPKRK